MERSPTVRDPELPVEFRSTGSSDLVRLAVGDPVGRDPSARVRVALIADRPVAVVRSARPEADGQPHRPGRTDPGLRSVELAVSDPWMDRRSTGARVLWAFAALLFRDPDVRRIQVDADVADEDLIHACGDVGFRSLGLFQGRRGTTHLFSVRRHELRSVAPASLSRVMVL